MRYMHIALTLLLAVAVSACGPAATGNGQVRPTQTSNDVAVANLRLGIAYMERGEYEKSLSKLDKALQADPNYFATFNVLGVLHQRMGEFQLAENYFNKSLRSSPSNPSTLNNYGQFLCSQGRLEEADEAFNKAANNPLYESPEIANANAGTCAMKNQRYDQAETYLRLALKQNPRIPAALLQMAELNVMQQNFLSARAYIERYTEVAKHSPKSLWLGIQTERELGDSDALSSYALLLKNNFPDSEEAKKLIESGIL